MVPMGAQELTCLCLGRSVFTDLLGPLEEIMAREKSAEVVEQRMRELEWAAPWMRANITIVDRKGRSESDMEGTCSNVTFVSLAPADYKEQQAPVDGAGAEDAKEGGAEEGASANDVPTVDIELREGTLLGGGASGSRSTCIIK